MTSEQLGLFDAPVDDQAPSTWHTCGRCGQQPTGTAGTNPTGTTARIHWATADRRLVLIDCRCGYTWQETQALAGGTWGPR